MRALLLVLLVGCGEAATVPPDGGEDTAPCDWTCAAPGMPGMYSASCAPHLIACDGGVMPTCSDASNCMVCGSSLVCLP